MLKQQKKNGIIISHFKKLLEGTDEEEDGNQQGERMTSSVREHNEIEKEIEEAEIYQAISRTKKGKAAGIDGIPIKVWIFGGYTIREGFVDLVKQIWKEGFIPKDWRHSVVVPLYKKGDPGKADNYRGISTVYCL